MIKHSVSGGVTRATFEAHSRLDVSNVSEVKQELLALAKLDTNKVEIDLSSLDYIDSSGVGALLSLLRLCKEKKCQLTLKSPQQNVRDLFNLLQLQSIFNLI